MNARRVKLAALGGTPVVSPADIRMGYPFITQEDKDAVMSVLNACENGTLLWGTRTPQILGAESEWAEYVGRKYCLLTNSGTAALHMAVAAAGVGPGDEVITSAFTFIASATSVLHHNGIPVFVDVDLETALMDPRRIEAAITERTKAITAVHIHGLPADMEEINAIARKHRLLVIEDAAQAPGATYRGRKVGALGDMACFSLNGCKQLTCGEGGFFVTDDEELYEAAGMVRVFGEAWRKAGKREYNAYGMGWMYRTMELPAALVRTQLKHLDEQNATRQDNAAYLTSRLSRIKGLHLPVVPGDRTSVWWLYPLRVRASELGINLPQTEFRDRVVKAIEAEGVPCHVWQTMPVPGQMLFQQKQGYGKGCPWTCPHSGTVNYSLENFPNAMKFCSEYFYIGGLLLPTLALPNAHQLMNKYAEAIEKVMSNLDQVVSLLQKQGD